jgi:glycine hydroxymethyltransferase
LNKNTIPADPSSPFYPSGVRLGTPAITSRGMKETEMDIIAGMIVRVINEVKGYEMPDEKEKRAEVLKQFRADIENNQTIKEVREDVVELCTRFPLYKK